MPLEDLDLVFDDEDESKKKKNDMSVMDQEISFAGQESVTSLPKVPDKKPPNTPAEIKSMEDWKNQKGLNASVHMDATVKDIQVPASVPQKKEIPLDQYQIALKQAEIKLAISEYKLELFSELQSDMKLMDYQINQLLLRMHQKHPDLKPEILAIKKILADFNTKKRK